MDTRHDVGGGAVGVGVVSRHNACTPPCKWLEHKIPRPPVGLTLAVAAWWFSPDGWWGDASLLRQTLAGALALVGLGSI